MYIVRFICLSLCALMIGCGSEYSDYIDQLQSGTSSQRAQAAAFLGAQRMAEAIPHLRDALRDTAVTVRAKSAWALGMLHSKAALPDLIPLLRDEHRDVRQAASVALMQIEEPEAIPALQKALEIEPDAWVKRDLEQAIQHLRQFEGEADVGEGRVRGEFF